MGKKYQALAFGGVIIIALIILSFFAFGPKQTNQQPDLIEITNLTPNSIIGHVVARTDNLNVPSGFEMEIETQEYVWSGDKIDLAMTVYVLCLVAEVCPDQIDETYVELNFEEFVNAEQACEKFNYESGFYCPYYNLGAFNLFDVTWENGKIIGLKQRYTP